jgi:hypothetical protein
MYLTVLDKAVTGKYQEQQKLEFYAVIHSVLVTMVVVATSLDIDSLAYFAAISSEATIRTL